LFRSSFGFLSGLEESLEERAKLPGAPEVLRVPLDPETEPEARILDGLDDAVGCGSCSAEAWSEILDGLMMPTVHLAGISRAE
jgi:hypothetical protein